MASGAEESRTPDLLNAIRVAGGVGVRDGARMAGKRGPPTDGMDSRGHWRTVEPAQNPHSGNDLPRRASKFSHPICSRQGPGIQHTLGRLPVHSGKA